MHHWEPGSKNGLDLNWADYGRVYLNPPYGEHTFTWMRKFGEHKRGIALIFARTDTKGFHDHARPCTLYLLPEGPRQIPPPGRIVPEERSSRSELPDCSYRGGYIRHSGFRLSYEVVMTASCSATGQEWVRDPAHEVACPKCERRTKRRPHRSRRVQSSSSIPRNS